MRLETRLRNAERRAHGGMEPLIVWIRSFAAEETGERIRKGCIVTGPGQSELHEARDDESSDAFMARIEQLAKAGTNTRQETEE